VTAPTCDRCGRPADGFAMIGDRRLCHPDYGRWCQRDGSMMVTWTAPAIKAAALQAVALAAAVNRLDWGGMTSVEYVRRLRDEW
jgi:hypothetical protein